MDSWSPLRKGVVLLISALCTVTLLVQRMPSLSDLLYGSVPTPVSGERAGVGPLPAPLPALLAPPQNPNPAPACSTACPETLSVGGAVPPSLIDLPCPPRPVAAWK